MGRIQVDMFEVQLGASILVQIEEDNGQVWRILADGGIEKKIKAQGYYQDHVAMQLPDVIDSFKATDPAYPIDLMVGTHYDEDHLFGLVKVVDNNDFDIKMAWVPPVANDATTAPMGDTLDDDDFLSNQFASESGTEIFNRYVDYQLATCREMKELQDRLIEGVNPETFNLTFPMRDFEPFQPEEIISMYDGIGLEQSLDPGRFGELQWHLHESARWLPEKYQGDHDDYIYEEESFVSEEFKSFFPSGAASGFFTPNIALSDSIAFLHTAGLAPTVMARAALIRKSSANNAINATYLNQLVKALRQKSIPTCNYYIQAGQPRFFVATPRGFQPTTEQKHQNFNGPKLTLLGPSYDLIKKHRDKLPIQRTMAFVLSLKTTTPSNQLSYVLILELEGQRILITGDAGFSDFNPKPRAKYFPDLLAQLYHLDVLQVAHHAGNNHHFYRVLHQAPYANDDTYTSHLLLSHAVNDKDRPSAAFDAFVSLLRNSCDMTLCFTSEPDSNKVASFQNLINNDTGYPVNTGHQVGNIRLLYDGGNWSALDPN